MSREPESHYEVLGVPRDAPAELIRRQYLALAAKYHPDKHAGHPLEELAAKHLARLNEAYAVLSDAAARAAYDAALGGTRRSFVARDTGRGRESTVSGGRLGRWLRWGLFLLFLPSLLRVVARLVSTRSGLVLLVAIAAGLAIVGLVRQRRLRGGRL